MSIGNGNPKEGDKGSNFNYELKVLQALDAIATGVENLPVTSLNSDILITDSNLTVTSDATTLTAIVCLDKPQVSTISAPNCTTVTTLIDINTFSSNQTVNLPSLITVGSYVNMTDLISLDIANLQAVGGNLSITYSQLTTIDLRDLTTVLANLVIAQNSLMTILDISSLVNVNQVQCDTNISLSTVSINSAISSLHISFENCALSVGSVDGILNAVDAAGYSGGTLFLNNGTNAAPTGGAGNANYVSLIGKGWTVNINP